MSNIEEKERGDKVYVGNYGRYPIAIKKGSGCVLTDADGKEYLDFLSGIAVCNLGHCHPKVVKAIQEQAETLLHVSNLYYIDKQTTLAELLTENSFADKVFFCNSGAEANEAAIKLARIHAPEGKGTIISLSGSFHGRTMATLAATGQPKFGAGFEPLPGGFVTVEFGDLKAIEDAIDDTTCAILCEPLQGEVGVRPHADNYLQGVRELCDKYSLSLIFDEVQTGIGRSGTLFAYQQLGVEPDIMTLAKGLGSGVPIGAMLAREDIAAALVPGTHGSTFGGNPLVCAAAIATLEVMLADGFFGQVAKTTAYLTSCLAGMAKDFPTLFTNERGLGLLRALIFTEASQKHGASITNRMMAAGFLINFAGGIALRFAPPLIVTEEQIDAMLKELKIICSDIVEA
ncbi:MAG: aspartate aminotransferase family protein [Desulfotalea sp.]